VDFPSDENAQSGSDEPEGPIAAERPGLWVRLREQLALRRALSRTDSDDVIDGVEIVSGAGAPVRLGRSRADLARRRSEALRPAQTALPGGPSAIKPPIPPAKVTVWPSAEPKEAVRLSPGERTTGQVFPSLEPPAHSEPSPSLSRDEINRPVLPGLLGQLPPPARPSSLPGRAIPLEPPGPSGPLPQPPWDVRGEPERASAAALSPPRQGDHESGLIGRRASSHRRPRRPTERSPSEAREARRLLALFGGAVAVMFVVGLASARSTLPLPVSVPQANPVPQASAAPSGPSQKPAPPASPRPSTSPARSGQPQLTGVQVFGTGGKGWQIQSIRYGGHPGFLRMVFDLGPVGAATGTPKVTVGYSDPTTVLVVFDGVLPAGSTGSPQTATSLASVLLLLPSTFAGSTVYQLKLTHPVTVAPTYSSTPLRLVLDIPI